MLPLLLLASSLLAEGPTVPINRPLTAVEAQEVEVFNRLSALSAEWAKQEADGVVDRRVAKDLHQALRDFDRLLPVEQPKRKGWLFWKKKR